MKEFSISATDGLQLSCTIFEHVNPKSVVQVIHGAKEHKERYYQFAEYLNTLGMAVMLSDSRGHGHSIDERYPLGHMDNWSLMVEDQFLITNHVKSLYPNVPIYMFAHSFGSVLARCYLQKHDDEIEKLVLSGTANYQGITRLGIPLGSIITLFGGKTGHNALMQKIGDSDAVEWICSDEKVLQEIRNDPLCSGYKYTNSSILTIWKADYQLHNFSRFGCKNPGLNILSVTGADDPIPGGDKGLADTEKSLRRIGYDSFQSKVYPNMKHEVINEIRKETVYNDIADFLNA